MTKSNLPFLTHGGATLSDRDIKVALEAKYFEIESPFPLNIQPSSIDLHLAPTILIFPRVRKGNPIMDLKEPADQFVEYVEIPKSGFVLHPREFLLGATSEWLKLPKQLCASVDGKSSLGRLGLVIHSTAGFIDPGFVGHVTLEITNLTEQPLRIYPNIPIGQIRFLVLTSEAENSYGSAILGSKKYKNTYSLNPKPIASQYWKNLK